MGKILIYTLHKAGSIFLHKLTQKVTTLFEIDYISINKEEYFDSIFNDSWNTHLESAYDRPTCFGPIRSMEAMPNVPHDLKSCNVLFHTRDPRDILISLYYSNLYSHPRKEGRFNPANSEIERWEAIGPDACVLEWAPHVKTKFDTLSEKLLSQPNVRLIQYEKMVKDFRYCLYEYLEPFHENLLESAIESHSYFDDIHKEFAHELEVPEENERNHKRQVKPGDHERKLKPETINKLNQILRSPLQQLGYQ